MLDWSKLYEECLGDCQLPDLPARLVIPRPSKSVTEFLEIARSSSSTLQQVTEAIERDTELTTQVLRLINSSAFGLKQRVTSIPRAITLLGHRRCKVMLMSAALAASMTSANQGFDGADGFLAKSLERAIFARQTAMTLNVDAEAAYVAALLQDLLLPFLQHAYPNDYNEFLRDGEPLDQLERARFGWDHATMAATILKSWNFPTDVVCCVAYHHQIQKILQVDHLRTSGLIAPALSALLPDGFQQEPEGVLKLFHVQQAIPDFRFIEIAAEVDDEFGQPDGQLFHRISLCDHLSRLAVGVVEQKRAQTNWLGKTIGRYTLEEKIGQGSMGEVYRARHSMLRRPAAVKLMSIAHLNPEAILRFEKEAQTTSELSSPHTVQVYDYGTTSEGVLFYVMEYLDGMSLRELIETYGPIPEGRVIHILSQVCGSLAEAHGKGLIHRDVKPDNIVLSISGGVCDFAKLLDFGLVEVVGGHAEKSGGKSIQGTPLYMAPEAILNPEHIDGRTDVYALGAVAYYLLTGMPLFPGKNITNVLHAQVHEIPPTPSELLGEPISDDLEGLIMQCLQKPLEQRPGCVLEVAERLSRCPSANQWSFADARQWWAQHDNSRDSRYSLELMRPEIIDCSDLALGSTSQTHLVISNTSTARAGTPSIH
ncbi:MAG: HDOD domain-containing protein [Planctomycetaceae bacterium]|nr:HDOD domain-containing protein [Planctomycetaceae bacterium]